MSATMRAVAALGGLPLNDCRSLRDTYVEVPALRPRDVLVDVRAVSVGPLDVALRDRAGTGPEPTIPGFDATGVVTDTGSEVQALRKGDEVWYAGDVTRPGTSADLHAVDERIVARKPVSLSFAEAAALPFTALVAWDTLFERLRLDADSGGTLLALGAAGGVGSVLIQLAKQLTGVRVLAAASRPESRDWVLGLGADETVDHRSLVPAVGRLAPDGVDHVVSPYSRGNVEAFATVLRPFGQIVALDAPEGLDLLPLRGKSITWHWHDALTRPAVAADAPERAGSILTRIARLVDEQRLRSTLVTGIHDFSAQGIREAHLLVRSGGAIGRVVVHR